MTTPSIAILVVSWNGREDTLACLESLSHIDYPSYEVVLVDNGSVDGSVPAIRKAFPEAHLIETGDNLGFVGGNNTGLQDALGKNFDYTLLLNNDTIVAPDFLSCLVEAAEAGPKVGIAGPLIYYYSQPDMVWSAGGEIDRRHGLTRMLGIGEVDRGQFGEQPRPVDFVTGCALLIKLSLVRQMGLLDPRFYAYYEETEWCVRAARLGYQSIFVPQAKIWHKITPEAREASPQVHYYMTRNRLLFIRLAQLGRQPMLNSMIDYGRTLLSWTVKPRWRRKRPQRDAMVAAIQDYFSGKFGRRDVV